MRIAGQNAHLLLMVLAFAASAGCAKSLADLSPFPCAEDETCPAGFGCNDTMQCIPLIACPSGMSDCDGGCIPTESDPSNCGTCGNACAAGQSCSCGNCATEIVFGPEQSGGANPLFNADTVETAVSGGTSITTYAGYTFGTQSYFGESSSFTGLPDDAAFAAVCPNVAAAQLNWTSSANVLNTMFLSGSGGSFQFAVPPGNYSVVQIYATAVNGGGKLTSTLSYAGGASETSTTTIADWCYAPTPGQYVLAKTTRTTRDVSCSIFAINLQAESSQQLASVALSYVGESSESDFGFYGATAW